ncbi:MAG TPA: DUF559 domain-containing protein [Chitinophagaceae bacterium]|nr:DUF559 domain-containing protein [Chitinophagaceae bacterium]
MTFIGTKKKLVVELDGSIHDERVNKDYDDARTAMLAGLNVIVLRFKKEEVRNNIKDVLNKIREVADLQNSDV